MRRVIGRTRTLRFFLTLAWVSRRLAHEIAGEEYGEDYHSNALGLNEAMLLEVIPKDGSVIDIGCGRGRWCRVAAERAGEVVGIDYDEAVIELARHKTTSSNVSYLVADFNAGLEGIVRDSFDVALLIHVIEHIDDPETLLASVKQFATNLIVEVPDFDADPLNLVRTWVESPFFSDADHVREYSQKMLEEHLTASGWTITGLQSCRGSLVATARH